MLYFWDFGLVYLYVLPHTSLNTELQWKLRAPWAMGDPLEQVVLWSLISIGSQDGEFIFWTQRNHILGK